MLVRQPTLPKLRPGIQRRVIAVDGAGFETVRTKEKQRLPVAACARYGQVRWQQDAVCCLVADSGASVSNPRLRRRIRQALRLFDAARAVADRSAAGAAP